MYNSHGQRKEDAEAYFRYNFRYPMSDKRKREEKGKEKEVEEPEKKKTKTGFTLHTGQLFLTYPQCALGLEESLLQVADKLGQDPEKYLIAQETHQVDFIPVPSSPPRPSLRDQLAMYSQEEDAWYYRRFLPIFETSF